ncbi:hypothetical protein CLOM_g1571 [Closterium sp. NIES-68]|nr:hypothetical protein CLOM_g1571 [Closterium sp. NIES-68]GJP85972.1 hypothetical protein CLOP_g16054 [Closterium sp. NIES-67]
MEVRSPFNLNIMTFGGNAISSSLFSGAAGDAGGRHSAGGGGGGGAGSLAEFLFGKLGGNIQSEKLRWELPVVANEPCDVAACGFAKDPCDVALDSAGGAIGRLGLGIGAAFPAENPKTPRQEHVAYPHSLWPTRQPMMRDDDLQSIRAANPGFDPRYTVSARPTEPSVVQQQQQQPHQQQQQREGEARMLWKIMLADSGSRRHCGEQRADSAASAGCGSRVLRTHPQSPREPSASLSPGCPSNGGWAFPFPRAVLNPGTPAVATPAVATPAVATPAVATPAVATPAVATPAVATPAVAAPDTPAAAEGTHAIAAPCKAPMRNVPPGNYSGVPDSVVSTNGSSFTGDEAEPSAARAVVSGNGSPHSVRSRIRKKQESRDCGLCGKSFSSGQALGGHMRKHWHSRSGAGPLEKLLLENKAGQAIKLEGNSGYTKESSRGDGGEGCFAYCAGQEAMEGSSSKPYLAHGKACEDSSIEHIFVEACASAAPRFWARHDDGLDLDLRL